MQKLTSLQRMHKAIHLQEPDIVPTFEGLIDHKVRDAIVPGASYEDFVDFMDLDGIVLFDKLNWDYQPVDAATNTMRDQWGGLLRFTSEEVGHPIAPAIRSESELDNYIPPDPDLPWRYEKLKKLMDRFKGKRAVIAHVTDVFDVARESLLGDVEYYKGMKRNPELIDRVNGIVLDYQLKYLGNCLDVGADMVFVTGDWATAQGPMASPELTKRFITLYFEKIVEYCHSRGVPCLKHTDGNIWSIFDQIVDAGANAIHPIDPSAGMDIGEAKAKYGDRICLMGNVDCTRLLSWGTEEEVREAVKTCIRKAGQGGGYICMSSNSIHSGVKPANYVAMVKAIKEYGQYPLQIS